MRAILLIVVTGVLLGGCAKPEVVRRLGAGECAVVLKDNEVLTVGQNCKIERMYR